MSAERDWREKLAFLASGALEPADRDEVLARLASDAEARRLLQTAEELVAPSGTDPLDVPVDPLLLVEYAESPDSLPPEVRSFVEARLERCDLSRSALERLRAVDSMAAAAPAAGTTSATVASALSSFWSMLRGSVLHPVPALAYLALLIAALPVVLRGGAGPAAPLPAPAVVGVTGEAVLREGGADASAPVLELSAPQPGRLLMLVLRTGLLDADLERREVSYEVVLSSGSREQWSRAVDRGEFRRDGGRVELPLPLDTAGLEPGVVYRLELRARAPGDPLDGAALFVRRFTLAD